MRMYTEGKIVVSAMYKFVALENYQSLRQPLYDFMLANDIYTVHLRCLASHNCFD